MVNIMTLYRPILECTGISSAEKHKRRTFFQINKYHQVTELQLITEVLTRSKFMSADNVLQMTSRVRYQ